MSIEPRELLATSLRELATAQSVDVNVVDAPASTVAAPALVIRPGNPWRSPTAATTPRGVPLSANVENYDVVSIVLAGDPASAVDQLRAMIRLIEDVQDVGPWRWVETTGIVQLTEQGIDYLGATTRMQYLEG